MTAAPLIVTGAAGHFGRLVVEALIEHEKIAPARIVAATRDPSKIADLAARGVKTVRADFDDPASLDAAFTPGARILLVSTDALDRPGRRLEQHRRAIDAAKGVGAGRILYTSMPSPETSRVTFAGDHLGSENAIKATGLPYTILRNGWYLENMFMTLPQAFASGQWYTSAGDGRLAHIARADLARAAAGALARDLGVSRTLTLTGSTARTTAEIAALAAAAVGKPLQVVDLTDEQLAGGMKAAGVPDFLIPTFVSFDTNTREGHIAMVTGDLAALTGQKPVELTDFLETAKGALGG